MTRKSFLVLLALLIVLLGAGVAVYLSQRADWRSSDTRVGQRLVPGLVISNVGLIHIQEPGSEVNIEHKDTGWTVRERNNYPANLDRIAEFLDKLAGLKVVQVEPLPESQRQRLQLVEPKGEAKEAGTLVEIKDKAGKQIARLILGRKVVRQSATTAPTKGSPDPSGRYVAGTEPGVFVVVSDPLTLAEGKPQPWLGRDLIRVTQAKRMTSIGPNGKVRWSAVRDSENADWKSAQPGDKLDNNKLQDLVSVLIYVALADVAPDASKAGFENGPSLKIDTFHNYHYTLTFGDQTGDLRYMKVALEGDPPPTRPPEKGESAEDKEKKDKQYLEDHKGMLAQIAREKKLEGWTFLVKNDDVQALLRDRAQLLPEKKDAKKDDGKK